jgi:hypothetical protein
LKQNGQQPDISRRPEQWLNLATTEVMNAIWRAKRALMKTRKDLQQRILEVTHSLAGQDYQIAFLRDIAEAKKHDPTHSVHFNLKKAASKRRQLKIELDRLQARLRLQIRPPE